MDNEDYKKLYVSEVYQITSERGVRVELSNGPNDLALAIWTMYRGEDGEWHYTSTKFGARNIRLPVDTGVADFLHSELGKIVALVRDLEAEASRVKSKAKAKPEPGMLPNHDEHSLLATLTNFFARLRNETADEKNVSKSPKNSQRN